jgi:hypothetical protein
MKIETEGEVMRTRNTFNDLKTKLTENDIDQIIRLIGKGCRHKTLVRLRSVLTYGPSTVSNYGILARLIRDKNGWEYCAGQSYTDEIRTVRECILGRV